MTYNFLRGGRDQPFLLPPDLRDWLPQDHLAWFILDVVDQLDLAPFYRAHRDDGHGHPAYDPKLLLGVLLYAYATGVRSSRQILLELRHQWTMGEEEHDADPVVGRDVARALAALPTRKRASRPPA